MNDLQQLNLKIPSLVLVASSASWTALLQDDHGQDLIEYALVAALIGLGALAAMRGLGIGIGGAFNSISSTVTSTT